jgi:hypothetical protein
MRLRPAQKQGEGDKERIVAPGDMLIFVSGRYPILGKQMLYFSDNVLRMRSEMPSPKGSTQTASGAATQVTRMAAPAAYKKTPANTSSSGGQERGYVPKPFSETPSLIAQQVPAENLAADEIPVHQPLSSLSPVTPRNVEQLGLWMDR